MIKTVFSKYNRTIQQDKKVKTPDTAKQRLVAGNHNFIKSKRNPAKIDQKRIFETSCYGQQPYAVIVSCSDSRVSPEHIFSAGIGDLFVIRTAGNVLSEFEIGSVEFGVSILGAKIIVVMGHSNCGAIQATLDGTATGKMIGIVAEIKKGIGEEKDYTIAENINIAHSARMLMTSEKISQLVRAKDINIIQAKYDIYTGCVEFFD